MIDIYLDLIRELYKLWNMRVTVIPFTVSSRGIVSLRIRIGTETAGNTMKN